MKLQKKKLQSKANCGVFGFSVGSMRVRRGQTGIPLKKQYVALKKDPWLDPYIFSSYFKKEPLNFALAMQKLYSRKAS